MSAAKEFSQFVKHGKKIIGIGRNYRWEKQKLAAVLPIPKEPIVFLKPTTSYITKGQVIKLPQTLGTIFYELELGIVFGKSGKDIPESEVLDHIAGYFLVLDMTAKEFVTGRPGAGNLPWEIGKGWDTACPVGDFVCKSLVPDPNNVHLEAKLNGRVTQSANTKEMIFNIQQLVTYVSKYMTIEPYDTMLTGAPDGFGPMVDGDTLEGRMDRLSYIDFKSVACTTN